MNDTKIKIIRKMPDGDKIIVLWIGILCLGMKSGNPGILEIGDGIPFNAEILAGELDVPLNTVKLGLETFKKLKMIELLKNETIFVKNFKKHQNLDKIEHQNKLAKKRMIKYRNKQKRLLITDKNVTSNKCVRNATDKDLDKDIDKEKDIDIDIELLNFWNSQKIITHRSIDKFKSKIKTSLKAYSLEDIKQAIENYAHILRDDKYYWSHSWALDEFLQRGLDRFIDFEICHKNYLKKNDKSQQKTSQNETVYNQTLQNIKDGKYGHKENT